MMGSLTIVSVNSLGFPRDGLPERGWCLPGLASGCGRAFVEPGLVLNPLLLSPCTSKTAFHPLVEIKCENETKTTAGPAQSFLSKGRTTWATSEGGIWTMCTICAQLCSFALCFFSWKVRPLVSQALCQAQGFHMAFSIGWKHPSEAMPPQLLLWEWHCWCGHQSPSLWGDRGAERVGKSDSLQGLCACAIGTSMSRWRGQAGICVACRCKSVNPI